MAVAIQPAVTNGTTATTKAADRARRLRERRVCCDVNTNMRCNLTHRRSTVQNFRQLFFIPSSRSILGAAFTSNPNRRMCTCAGQLYFLAPNQRTTQDAARQQIEAGHQLCWWPAQVPLGFCVTALQPSFRRTTQQPPYSGGRRPRQSSAGPVARTGRPRSAICALSPSNSTNLSDSTPTARSPLSRAIRCRRIGRGCQRAGPLRTKANSGTGR